MDLLYIDDEKLENSSEHTQLNSYENSISAILMRHIRLVHIASSNRNRCLCFNHCFIFALLAHSSQFYVIYNVHCESTYIQQESGIWNLFSS